MNWYLPIRHRMHGIPALAGMALLFSLSACGLFQSAKLPSKAGITPGETITVKGDQNVYAVARQYHVSMRELIVLNDLHSPFTIRNGQKLTLPSDKTSSESYYSSSGYSSSYAPVPAAAPSPAIEQTALPPIQPSSVQSEALPPPQSTTSSNAPVKSTSVEALNAPSPPAKPVATTLAPQPSPAAAEKPSGLPSPPVSFKWPVQGPMLSSFGPKGQGLSNDGVNIGAPKGAPVVAAANGIVVYAGSEMKGFGNLVLIRHQGGWVTAYAHLDRALVSKDAVVAQGDMIGTVGKTGNVSSPQIHFEIRYQGKPVDPAGIIKSE
jgi:murein DD-endopeptidase MepM/ murein hydrolase activator NlpD